MGFNNRIPYEKFLKRAKSRFGNKFKYIKDSYTYYPKIKKLIYRLYVQYMVYKHSVLDNI